MTTVATVLASILAIQAAWTVLSSLSMTAYLFPTPATVSSINSSSYDVIIAGGGVAGSVLATRLAAANVSVLLIEFGTDPPFESTIASTIPYMIKSAYDYNYATVTNTEYNITDYRTSNVFQYISGKMLGGSSNIFTQYHIRSDPENYNEWAAYLNDSSYTYESLLPYFIKSENCQDSDVLASFASERGTAGPIGLTKQPFEPIEDFLAAFEELDNAILVDKSSEGSTGYFQPLYEIADDIPQATARKYLALVKDSEYLTVLTSTQVTKVVINENKTATGVEVLGSDGETYVFSANKEVIVSTGVLNTPKLLMLSGIGPKEHLESLGIDVIADLPVGQNLQDLYGVVLGMQMNKTDTALPTLSPYYAYPYFAGYPAVNRSQTYPDYLTENFLTPHGSYLVAVYCSAVLGLSDDVCQTYLDIEEAGYDFYLSIVVTLSPKSRGSIQLQSTDPADAPIIYAPYLNNTQDLDDLVKYVKDHVAVLNTTYFQSVGAEFVPVNLTECASYEVESDDYWYCYAPKMLTSIYKYTSSCAMGSVVDTSFNVKGVDNLRVVDASVFPNVTRAHVISTVLALSEKAADIILKDLKHKHQCN